MNAQKGIASYSEALWPFFAGWQVWEGDGWLRSLCPDKGAAWGQMPEHRRLLRAQVEYFPGSDYSLHLIPAGAGLPRPQADKWVIYAPGRASESTVYDDEATARRALYALVAHEVLTALPIDGISRWGTYIGPEAAGVEALTHVEIDGQVVGFGAITSYLPGNRVVFGLAPTVSRSQSTLRTRPTAPWPAGFCPTGSTGRSRSTSPPGARRSSGS